MGHGKYLLPALEKAKHCGLKLSLHLSEVRLFETVLFCSPVTCTSCVKLKCVCRFPPSWRSQTCCSIFLLTGLVMEPSYILKWVDLNTLLTKWWKTEYPSVRFRLQSEIKCKNIGAGRNLFLILYFLLELCLTSNVKGRTVPSYSQHHFRYWYQLGHPCVICVSWISALLQQNLFLSSYAFTFPN